VVAEKVYKYLLKEMGWEESTFAYKKEMMRIMFELNYI